MHALKEDGMAVETYLEYEGKRYTVQVAHNPIVDKPAMIDMHLDAAHAQDITDTH